MTTTLFQRLGAAQGTAHLDDAVAAHSGINVGEQKFLVLTDEIISL